MVTKEIQRKLFGQILLERQMISEKQLNESLELQKINGKALGEILVDLDYVTQEKILKALSDYLSIDILNLKDVEIDPAIIDKIPRTIAQLYRVLPVRYEDSTLTLALAQEHALNMEQMDDLRFLLHYNLKPVLVDKDEITEALDKFYPMQDLSVGELMNEFRCDTTELEFAEDREVIETERLKELANEAPVKTFVNLILLQAVMDKASDIHFEAFEGSFRVRTRVDGMLTEKIPVPPQFISGVVSRIKVMAEMDIAERRLPQDGRIFVMIRGHGVDIRVSTLPTKNGESIVMRILDKGSTSLDLSELGMLPEDVHTVQQLVKKPNCVILVTGPTGSGKTTTLYACLNHLNGPEAKLITTEDPVEYDIDGIMQIQVNSDIGVTFGVCLRAILRQDPDVILVGEIRDMETVEIAVQAALTGHLVLSTLHTNDAPSTITRLLNMGVKPYLITASLIAIIAQRLVRRICTKCKEVYHPSKEIIKEIGLTESDLSDKSFYKGKGCSSCNRTGYKGRLAVLEIMIINDEICSHIIDQSSIETIKDVARKGGMVTLSESGLNAAYKGITTLEEVIRETSV